MNEDPRRARSRTAPIAARTLYGRNATAADAHRALTRPRVRAGSDLAVGSGDTARTRAEARAPAHAVYRPNIDAPRPSRDESGRFGPVPRVRASAPRSRKIRGVSKVGGGRRRG